MSALDNGNDILFYRYNCSKKQSVTEVEYLLRPAENISEWKNPEDSQCYVIQTFAVWLFIHHFFFLAQELYIYERRIGVNSKTDTFQKLSNSTKNLLTLLLSRCIALFVNLFHYDVPKSYTATSN
jgi:hypothetical protein